jgi:regulator of sirC expression with transglutaminase-like and TPR domain
MSLNEIQALLRLIDDNNLALAEQARDSLVEYGAVALPALQAYADINPLLAANLTQRIQARLLEAEWAALAQRPDAEAAALLLARWLDPLLDTQRITSRLDRLAEPLRGTLPASPTRSGYRREAHALREWLAIAKGFRGNVEDYYAPENSLLPHVLEKRRGLPLTLSMVYLFVARRLGAPLYGIGLPGHFIVRYGDDGNGIFIDPYNQGALMTRADCRRWLVQQNVPWREGILHPISDHAMIERMLRNLVNAYSMVGDQHAVAQTVKYFEIWTDHHAG